MTTRHVVLMASFAAAVACTGVDVVESPPPAAGEGPCNAGAAQALVGASASQQLGADAMQRSGAREFRWIPPNSAVTMDYRPTRLNVEYDEAGTVTAIRCG